MTKNLVKLVGASMLLSSVAFGATNSYKTIKEFPFIGEITSSKATLRNCPSQNACPVIDRAKQGYLYVFVSEEGERYQTEDGEWIYKGYVQLRDKLKIEGAQLKYVDEFKKDMQPSAIARASRFDPKKVKEGSIASVKKVIADSNTKIASEADGWSKTLVVPANRGDEVTGRAKTVDEFCVENCVAENNVVVGANSTIKQPASQVKEQSGADAYQEALKERNKKLVAQNTGNSINEPMKIVTVPTPKPTTIDFGEPMTESDNLLVQSGELAEKYPAEALIANLTKTPSRLPVHKEARYARVLIMPILNESGDVYTDYTYSWVKVKDEEFVLGKRESKRDLKNNAFSIHKKIN